MSPLPPSLPPSSHSSHPPLLRPQVALIAEVAYIILFMNHCVIPGNKKVKKDYNVDIAKGMNGLVQKVSFFIFNFF